MNHGDGFTFLTYAIDIDQKPILALGTISIVLLTLVFLVASPWMISPTT